MGGNFNLILDPTRTPIGDWFAVDLTVDTAITGLDYQFLSHGVHVTPVVRTSYTNFDDFYKADLNSDLGASIDDVSKPLSAGTYRIAEYSFPQGTDQITVYGSYAGPPPQFPEATITPSTLNIPEVHGLLVIFAIYFFFRRKPLQRS